MKKLLIVILFLICANISFGQSKVDLIIQLLTPDLIGEATLDKEPLFDWIKKIKVDIEDHFQKEKGDNDIMIQFTLHRDKQPTMFIGTRPKFNKSSIDELTEKINKYKGPNTKNADYSFLFYIKLNNGCSDTLMAYTPELIFPEDLKLSEFKSLDLENKKKYLQNWMKNEVIPIIAIYETKVDTLYKGVLNIGKLMQEEKFANTDVTTLTNNNSDYWRAVMEMSQGNQLIPFSKICMHLAKGEFDIAKRLLFVIDFFSEKSTLAAIYHENIMTRIKLIDDELNSEINKGIALHDKGKYKNAVSQYENLLKVFPNSAWLNYELYYSKTAEIKDMDEVDKEWNKSKITIYKCDPMYPLNVRAKSGKEGYLLFRRQEINNLFKSNENLKKDFIEYADIAFDLEDYGFSAQLYWLIFSYFDKIDYNDRNILAYYLYSLDKLGDKESIKSFKGNFEKEFNKIEKERKKIMEESSIYNAFEKKN